MFTPDPKSRKYLAVFQGERDSRQRSLSPSAVLRDTLSGRLTIRWNQRLRKSPGGGRNLISPRQEEGKELADKFLSEHREFLEIPEYASDMQCTSVKERQGEQHVTYQQRYQGVPVVGSTLTVHIDREQRVQMVNGGYCLNVDAETPPAGITEAEALERVCQALETEERPEGQTERVIFPRAGGCIAAYQVHVSTKTPLGDWIFFVNAANGDIVDGYNALHFVKGSGHLYDVNPERDASVVTAELFDLDESKTLSGQYFAVSNDAQGVENASPTGPGIYDFLYSDPADTHFDEVMVYYHLNKIARFFRNLGHAEHSSSMAAHVHVPDPSTGDPNYDNAYFSSFDHAIYFGHGDALNDLAQEAAVIYHEYGHSIVDAVQPFMGTTEAGALHEGYADYFGCSLTNDPKIGEFVVGQIGKSYLRDLRSAKTYEDFTGLDVHEDGVIWGATCWTIRETLGSRVADKLIYEGLWFLPQNATFVDASEGILQADINVFHADHLDVLQEIFRTRHLLIEEEPETPHEPTERTVFVSGATEWMESGMTVTAGDRVSITARGSVIYDKHGHSCGPEGTSWTDSKDREDPLWQQPHAGLIGKIEGSEPPVFLGASCILEAGSSGKLLLGINDYWYQGNSGEFTVTIRHIESS